jgi:hypothetical protein
MIEPVEAFRIPSADIHGLRELTQQIIGLEAEITEEGFEKLREIVKKVNWLLSPGA